MNFTKTILLLLLLLPFTIAAQTIKGKVYGEVDGKREPLAGAVILWSNSQDGAISSEDGSFSIKHPKGVDTLTCSFLGYAIDTVMVGNRHEIIFNLKAQDMNIDEVLIVNRKSNVISGRAVSKTEIITYAGLRKMACCNLAESFENSASVTVGYSDAVSGARQIRMLGYSGVYTQMLDETRPIMRGLSSTYGLSFVPGMWLKSIQISKGVTSVTNGYEALTGQINLEHRKPTDEESLFVNLYFDQDLRAEANITSALQINEHLSTIILTHVAADEKSIDHNHDSFLDAPFREHYNVANRWLYTPESGIQIRAGVRYLYEDRDGGQTSFDKTKDRGTQNAYGSQVANRNFNAYAKVAVPLLQSHIPPSDPMFIEQTVSNIAFIGDYSYHKLNAFFGLKDYRGEQNSFMLNAIYEVNYGTRHKLVAGGSVTADLFEESLFDKYSTTRRDDGVYNTEEVTYNFDRNDFTAGAFGEYTLNVDDKLSVVAGMRFDYNDEYGFMFSPRGHLKWNLAPATVLRLSGGVGFRNSTLISDNMGVLATGRKIVFDEAIDRMERGVTYGASFTQVFQLFNDPEASFSVDFFRSGFTNQVICDQERDSKTVHFYNLNGKSYTNTYQVDLSFEVLEGFTTNATFRYNDTKIDLQKQGLVERPLIDRFKGVLNFQYATKFNKWIFDFTAQINGQSRLPQLTENHYVDSYSPVYPIFFAQVTKRFRKFELYLGCENVFDYKQDDPIISSSNPFSTEFNSTAIWGPLMGRKTYIGMRFTL